MNALKTYGKGKLGPIWRRIVKNIKRASLLNALKFEVLFVHRLMLQQIKVGKMYTLLKTFVLYMCNAIGIMI